MPIDWENNIISKDPNCKTRFTSVAVDDASSCQKVSVSISFHENLFLVLRKIYAKE